MLDATGFKVCVCALALLALSACAKEDENPSAGAGGAAGAASGTGVTGGMGVSGMTGGSAGMFESGGIGGDMASGGTGVVEVPQIPVVSLCNEDGSLPVSNPATGTTVIATGLFEPVPVRVDATSLWYTDTTSTGDALFRMPKAGGTAEIVAQGSTMYGLTTNDTHAFWSETDSTTQLETIKSVALDASDATPDELATGIEEINYLSATADSLFFADRTIGILHRLALTDGAMVESFATNIIVQGMDLYEGYVYFTDFNAEAVMRIAQTGGTPETLASAFFPESVAVSADGVFYAGSFQTLDWIPLTGGTPVNLYTTNEMFNNVGVAAAGDGDVFWYLGSGLGGGCGGVNRAKADGSDHTVYSIPAPIGPLLEPGAMYFAAGDGDFFDPHGVLLRIDR